MECSETFAFFFFLNRRNGGVFGRGEIHVDLQDFIGHLVQVPTFGNAIFTLHMITAEDSACGVRVVVYGRWIKRGCVWEVEWEWLCMGVGVGVVVYGRWSESGCVWEMGLVGNIDDKR